MKAIGIWTQRATFFNENWRTAKGILAFFLLKYPQPKASIWLKKHDIWAPISLYKKRRSTNLPGFAEFRGTSADNLT